MSYIRLMKAGSFVIYVDDDNKIRKLCIHFSVRGEQSSERCIIITSLAKGGYVLVVLVCLSVWLAVCLSILYSINNAPKFSGQINPEISN